MENEPPIIDPAESLPVEMLPRYYRSLATRVFLVRNSMVKTATRIRHERVHHLLLDAGALLTDVGLDMQRAGERFAVLQAEHDAELALVRKTYAATPRSDVPSDEVYALRAPSPRVGLSVTALPVPLESLSETPAEPMLPRLHYVAPAPSADTGRGMLVALAAAASLGGLLGFLLARVSH